MNKLIAGIVLCVAAMTTVRADDSGMLVFEMAEKQSPVGIAISNEDGTNLRMLAERGGNPRWFPSGNRIAYYLTKETENETAPHLPGETLIVDLNGRLIRKIPYWVSDISKDGNKLLVQRIFQTDGRKGGTSYELGIYDLITDSYFKILSPKEIPVTFDTRTPNLPKWFPDGQRILFNFLGGSGAKYFGELSLLDKKLRLIEIPKGIKTDSLFPGFDISPDGTKIAFAGQPQDHYEKPAIYVLNLENNSITLLYREKGNSGSWHPIWADNGTRLLFSFYIPDDVLGPESSLKIINADGTNVRRVFRTGIFHNLINTIGVAVPEQKENADWWQQGASK